jgi:hypothetical protein
MKQVDLRKRHSAAREERTRKVMNGTQNRSSYPVKLVEVRMRGGCTRKTGRTRYYGSYSIMIEKFAFKKVGEAELVVNVDTDGVCGTDCARCK